MKKFRLKTYELRSPKIAVKSGNIRVLFLSDQHGVAFGEKNCRLLAAVQKRKPDLILIGGDNLIARERRDLKDSIRLVRDLCRTAPVYHAMGNHEYRVRERREIYRKDFGFYEENLERYGVRFLKNSSACLEVRGTALCLCGLELDERYYRRKHTLPLVKEDINSLIGEPREGAYNILLAHSPKFGDAYLDWGGELTLSGHYHGGIVRFTENRGLIGAYLELMPPYCCGRFSREGREMIVSAGLGEHTVPVRIHNPRELIEINLRSL